MTTVDRQNGPGGVNVHVRAIVDRNGTGCTRHGDAAFGLCATCTLEMLHELAKSSGIPGLEFHANRVFGGLAALLAANPDVGKFGTDTVDRRDDVVRIPRRARDHAAIALATAIARLEGALDYTGALEAARVDLANVARDLELNPDALLRLGRDRLAAAKASAPVPPPPPDPLPEPPREPASPEPDPTAGFALDGDESAAQRVEDPRGRPIEDRRPAWWALRWGGRR